MNISELLFPSVCLLCGTGVCRPQTAFCDDCIYKLSRMLTKKCANCGELPLFCKCDSDTAFLFIYGNRESDRLIWRLKRDGDKRAFEFFGAILARYVCERFKTEYDAVTYVPRRRRGIRDYGYDHARMLASGVAKGLGVPCVKMLERYGSEQQKLLSADKRRKDLQKRYSVVSDADCEKYKTVLLVDDIRTTGATLTVCEKLLKKAGIKTVKTATLAKTRH